MDDIRRGEIFYIARGGATNGSEQFADRPAVVVSNDENNKHSGVIEVVYMTTQPKTDLPTHVTVRSKAAEAIKSWFSKVQEKNDAAA